MIRFGSTPEVVLTTDGSVPGQVRHFVTAMARVARRSGDTHKGILIASDTGSRYEHLVKEAATVLQQEGLTAHLASRDVPAPAVSFTVRRLEALGAIVFSKLPRAHDCLGIGVYDARGVLAPEEMTAEINREASALSLLTAHPARETTDEAFDPAEAYHTGLHQKVNRRAIRTAILKVAVETRSRCSRGYLDSFLSEAGVDVFPVADPMGCIAGNEPPGCGEVDLLDLAKIVVSQRCHIGLATCGNGSRFGVIDACGSYVAPAHCLMLLADRLLPRRSATDKRGAGRSASATHGIDAVAALHGAEVLVQAGGARGVAELFLQDRITIGAGENGEFFMAGHLPESDGILACLLLAEYVAETGKSVKSLVEELFEKTGSFYPMRISLPARPEQSRGLGSLLKDGPSRFAGLHVKAIENGEGTKLLLTEGRWVHFRPLGNENAIEVSAEADSEAETKRLLTAARKFVGED